jgi:hypothetical protein
MEAPQHVGARHIVTTLPHPRRNTAQSDSRGCQTKEDDLDLIAGSPPPFDSSDVTKATECGFECEIDTRSREAVEFVQEQPSRGEGSQLRT